MKVILSQMNCKVHCLYIVSSLLIPGNYIAHVGVEIQALLQTYFKSKKIDNQTHVIPLKHDVAATKIPGIGEGDEYSFSDFHISYFPFRPCQTIEFFSDQLVLANASRDYGFSFDPQLQKLQPFTKLSIGGSSKRSRFLEFKDPSLFSLFF